MGGVGPLNYLIHAAETHDLLHRSKDLSERRERKREEGERKRVRQIICAFSCVHVCMCVCARKSMLCVCVFTSSLAIRMSSVTLEKTVGWMKRLFRSQAPPHTPVWPLPSSHSRLAPGSYQTASDLSAPARRTSDKSSPHKL